MSRRWRGLGYRENFDLDSEIEKERELSLLIERACKLRDLAPRVLVGRAVHWMHERIYGECKYPADFILGLTGAYSTGQFTVSGPACKLVSEIAAKQNSKGEGRYKGAFKAALWAYITQGLKVST